MTPLHSLRHRKTHGEGGRAGGGDGAKVADAKGGKLSRVRSPTVQASDCE